MTDRQVTHERDPMLADHLGRLSESLDADIEQARRDAGQWVDREVQRRLRQRATGWSRVRDRLWRLLGRRHNAARGDG